MPYKKIVKTLPFQPREIYDMVINVEQYPCFVPHCAEVNVHESSVSRIIAEMIIEYHTVIKNFRISYISNVELYPENYTVLITNANDRFFKKLESSWKIKPCIEGSEITYEIAFELQNPVLNLTLSSLILKNSEIMIVAFTKRAFNLLKEIS
jgi:coenzyme Q-binding protein COQ10